MSDNIKNPTIEDLLHALQTNTTKGPELPNNAETWRRIGNKEEFPELNLPSGTSLESFLEEWISNNEYNV